MEATRQGAQDSSAVIFMIPGRKILFEEWKEVSAQDPVRENNDKFRSHSTTRFAMAARQKGASYVSSPDNVSSTFP